MESKRLANVLARDLFVLEDESNPRGSKADQVLPSTILDQVYDDQSPTHKNLRQIIEDLKQDILTGGRGNIVFPVTSVNGKTDDVVLRKADVGLGRVDNTADIDKPLSTPQRSTIMDILAGYDFHLNLDELYNHLMDNNNPHMVTIDQINKDDDLKNYIEGLIASHNYSNSYTVHTDIRRSLSTLWQLVDGINNSLEDRLAHTLQAVDDHIDDEHAHQDIMNLKEDIANRVTDFSRSKNNSYDLYPSTRSVVEYIENRLTGYRDELPQVVDWIDDIICIDTRDELPTASARHHRECYLIKEGHNSFMEVAICRKNPNDTYDWDITDSGAFSRLNPKHLKDTELGLSINLSGLIDDLLSENGALDTSLSEVLSHYYNKEDIDKFHYISQLNMEPGTVDGTIRFYINGDPSTMSDDINVAGLKRMAYLEYVTENELWDNSVWSRHILTDAIETRHIQDRAVTAEKLNCRWGYILGNTINENDTLTHEIKLTELADMLRPLIGGWPDPYTPGGNPWYDMIADQLIHPHLWHDEEEHSLTDLSYAMRFRGTISDIPNHRYRVKLTDKIHLGTHKLIDAGGSWMYQSNPEEWTILNGSNITGHTFATVTMTNEGTFLETISIGDRKDAPYDIWIKYVKPSELEEGQYEYR